MESGETGDAGAIPIAIIAAALTGFSVLLFTYSKIRNRTGILEGITGCLFYSAGAILLASGRSNGILPGSTPIYLSDLLLILAPVLLAVSVNRLEERDDRNRPILFTGAFSAGISFLTAIWQITSLLHILVWMLCLVNLINIRLPGRVRLWTPWMMWMGISALPVLLCSVARIVLVMDASLNENLRVTGLIRACRAVMVFFSISYPYFYLRMIIEDLLADLQRWLTERKELEMARDRFVSIVSHDIGGPLAAVQMGLYVVNEELNPGQKRMSDAELRNVLSMTRKTVERILSVQRNVVELYRMQRKQHKYQIELTDVSSLITPAIEVHRDEMPERGIEFNMEMPSGGLTVACDVNSMRAVFRNLISNAVRFTPDAGRISIDVYEREGWVVIRIFNSGATIPDETIKQIRTGMKVVPMTSATGESGSGMGLLLACEHMKGNRAVFEIQNVTDGVECIVRLRCPPA